MSDFRYDKPIVKKVHILGQDFECREPGLDEQTQYEKELSTTDDSVGVILKHLDNLGLPKEVIRKLPQAQVLKLLRWFSSSDDDSKKK
jgi:hypothetical protein